MTTKQNKRTKLYTMMMLLGTMFLFSLLLPTSLDGTGLGHEQEMREETTHLRSADAHLPIAIDGNAELAAFCTVGSGTEMDPYIIENLEIDATFAHGIAIRNTDAHLIIRNCIVVYGALIEIYNGIDLYNCEEIVISNNELINNDYGIYLADSSNNTISGNNCSANGYGISLSTWSNYNTISGNNCSANGYGIYFGDSSNNNTISGNNCSANDYGIYLAGSNNYNTISGNNCSANDYGIYLADSSNYNTISGNNCSAITNYGISLSDSSVNTVFNNTAAHNNIGIYLEASSNINTIWGNFLFENTEFQASSTAENINNHWDFEEVGNYYGDYLLQNPTAIIDGMVWNIPYQINGTTTDIDSFPLVGVIPPTNQIIFEGEAVSYQITATDNGAIVAYWLNDTSTFTIDATGLITNTSTLYSGIYNLEVFVNDTSGNELSATFSISVTASPPIWVIAPTNQIILEGEAVSYQITATDNGAIVAYWLNDTSTFTIDATGLITNTSTLYSGIYYLEVFVNDTNGNELSAIISITVLDNLPIAVFSVNSSSIYEGEWIQFTDESHHGNLPYTYEWDFGDGSANSSEQHPIHQYLIPGAYIVTLSVWDGNGDYNATTMQITVLEENPTISGFNPTLIMLFTSFSAFYLCLFKRKINKNTNC